MGVRAGQGFGVPKSRRLRCPSCTGRGVTRWQATAAGLMRYCQLCQAGWGFEGWRLAMLADASKEISGGVAKC